MVYYIAAHSGAADKYNLTYKPFKFGIEGVLCCDKVVMRAYFYGPLVVRKVTLALLPDNKPGLVLSEEKNVVCYTRRRDKCLQ